MGRLIESWSRSGSWANAREGTTSISAARARRGSAYILSVLLSSQRPGASVRRLRSDVSSPLCAFRHPPSAIRTSVSVTIDDIRAARIRLAPLLSPTPLRTYRELDDAVGHSIRVSVKHENF